MPHSLMTRHRFYFQPLCKPSAWRNPLGPNSSHPAIEWQPWQPPTPNCLVADWQLCTQTGLFHSSPNSLKRLSLPETDTWGPGSGQAKKGTVWELRCFGSMSSEVLPYCTHFHPLRPFPIIPYHSGRLFGEALVRENPWSMIKLPCIPVEK